MKDWFIGLISGIFMTIGMFLWIAEIKVLGTLLILLSWVLSVIVFGHYKYLQKKS